MLKLSLSDVAQWGVGGGRDLMDSSRTVVPSSIMVASTAEMVKITQIFIRG
jgi:hypothetical protein